MSDSSKETVIDSRCRLAISAKLVLELDVDDEEELLLAAAEVLEPLVSESELSVPELLALPSLPEDTLSPGVRD
jgi:hypothetical protein